mmetsp:Transcript_12002/g.16570  ORF Transcript_12002/g.16570 Transcript_12002/m.16570 type:complete len:93 (+) Transcript_12002:174-452(+)
MAILLGVSDKPQWSDCRKMMSNPANFLNKVVNYDFDNIDVKTLNKLKPYLKNPNLDPEVLKTKSKAAQSCAVFLHGVYKYGCMLHGKDYKLN